MSRSTTQVTSMTEQEKGKITDRRSALVEDFTDDEEYIFKCNFCRFRCRTIKSLDFHLWSDHLTQNEEKKRKKHTSNAVDINNKDIQKLL